jgi:hypothetical protein
VPVGSGAVEAKIAASLTVPLHRDPKRPRPGTGASSRGRHSYVPTIGGSRHTKASRPPAKGSRTSSPCLWSRKAPYSGSFVHRWRAS